MWEARGVTTSAGNSKEGDVFSRVRVGLECGRASVGARRDNIDARKGRLGILVADNLGASLDDQEPTNVMGESKTDITGQHTLAHAYLRVVVETVAQDVLSTRAGKVRIEFSSIGRRSAGVS